MYLLYNISLNITFAIRQLNKYNLNFRTGHIKAIKKIVKYLKRIIHIADHI